MRLNPIQSTEKLDIFGRPCLIFRLVFQFSDNNIAEY